MGYDTHGIGDQLSCSAGNGRLLHDDGTLAGILSNNSGNSLESSHVCRAASTDTTVLCWGVDGYQHNVRLGNALADISREEEVGRTVLNDSIVVFGLGLAGEGGLAATITGDADNVPQAGLVDGGVFRVPATDTSLVAVDDGDSDVRVLEGKNSGSRTTCMVFRTRSCPLLGTWCHLGNSPT
jgi:hypothetical protein